MHTRNLKQALSYGLILKKVHRIIKFNSDLKAKNDFEKDFFG